MQGQTDTKRENFGLPTFKENAMASVSPNTMTVNNSPTRLPDNEPRNPPVSTDPDQKTKDAATLLADYLPKVYGANTSGWNENVLKQVADNGKFFSDHFGGDVTVSKEVQDAAKTLMAAGGASTFDRDKDGYIRGNELEVYSTLAPGSMDIR